MNELLGTMTCECGMRFELRSGDSEAFFHDRLELHLRVHRLDKRLSQSRQKYQSEQDGEDQENDQDAV